MFSQASLPDAVQVPAGHKVAMQTVGVGEIKANPAMGVKYQADDIFWQPIWRPRTTAAGALQRAAHRASGLHQ